LNAEQLVVVAEYLTRNCYITWYQIPRTNQSVLLLGRQACSIEYYLDIPGKHSAML